MRIVECSVSNFKSYAVGNNVFDLNSDLNIIVGENNAGKSNLIRAIELIIQKLVDTNTVSSTDHHDKNHLPLEASMSVILDENDFGMLMEGLRIPASFREDFMRLFDKAIRIQIESSQYRSISLRVTCGDLSISHNRISTSTKSKGQRNIALNALIDQARTQHKSFYDLARENIQDLLPAEDVTLGIQIDENFMVHLQSLLSKKIIIFPEFRERPDQKASEVLSSPKGRELSSVLFNLKNGDSSQIERFKAIQEAFTAIFHNLKLEVNKNREIFLIKPNKSEVSQEHFGAGIVEIIILLTHLKHYDGYVFVLDEPELHLHPHAKRLAAKLVQESSERNQTICITHATEFARLDQFHAITVIKDKNGASEIVRLPKDTLGAEEVKKLLRIVDSEQKEFLFAKKALLIEGDTEMGAMPTLSQKEGLDFDFHGVSLLNVGGNYFASFIKVLRGFKIPYLVMCDKDVIMTISSHIEIDKTRVKTSSVFQQLDKLGELYDDEREIIRKNEKEIIQEFDDKGKIRHLYNDAVSAELIRIARKHGYAVLSSDFEGVFRNAGYERVLAEAKLEFGRSKVLQGKYLADNVNNTPDEITEVIKLACEQLRPV